MVLEKLKKLNPFGKKNKRDVSQVSSFDEDTKPERSPLSERRDNRDLDLPSERNIGNTPENSGLGSPRRGRSQGPRTPERRRQPAEDPGRNSRPGDDHFKNERERPRQNREPRNTTTDRRSDSPRETKEMLQEILRKLDDIDRKLEYRRR